MGATQLKARVGFGHVATSPRERWGEDSAALIFCDFLQDTPFAVQMRMGASGSSLQTVGKMLAHALHGGFRVAACQCGHDGAVFGE